MLPTGENLPAMVGSHHATTDDTVWTAGQAKQTLIDCVRSMKSIFEQPGAPPMTQREVDLLNAAERVINDKFGIGVVQVTDAPIARAPIAGNPLNNINIEEIMQCPENKDKYQMLQTLAANFERFLKVHRQQLCMLYPGCKDETVPTALAQEEPENEEVEKAVGALENKLS